MEDELKELASAFPFEEDRQTFLGMARQFKHADKSRPKDIEDDEMNKLVAQVYRGFRTAMYPIPSRDQLRSMIDDSTEV